MNSLLYNQFLHGIRWNALDSIISQGLLVAHHIAVRYFLGPVFHGEFGTAFSILYSLLVIVNMGLDSSLSPIFTYISANKRAALLLSRRIFFPQLTILMFSFIILVLVAQRQVAFNFLTGPISIIIGVTLIIESIRKSCRTFLQLALRSRLTAITEISGMIAYLIIVWSWFFAGFGMTLMSAFITLLIISSIQLIILAVGIHAWYTQLPDTTNTLPATISWRLAKSRFFVGSNQIISQLFTSNFLVPFFAVTCGLNFASFFKIISSVAQWITLVGQKIFGITGAAILARTKELSLETKRAVFIAMTHKLYQVLYILLICVIINGTTLYITQCSVYPPQAITIGVTMLVLSFLESFFVLFDRWYIIEERAYYLLFFTTLSCMFLYFSGSYILLSLVIIRVITIMLLTLFSFYYWSLRPSLKIEKESLGIALILSLLIYIIIWQTTLTTF